MEYSQSILVQSNCEKNLTTLKIILGVIFSNLNIKANDVSFKLGKKVFPTFTFSDSNLEVCLSFPIKFHKDLRILPKHRRIDTLPF